MEASLRTRWGSCDQIMPEMNQCCGGSAAITIASAPRWRASATMRLAALRVPVTWPLAAMLRRFSKAMARHAFVPLPHFSFIGQQSRIRQAEARAPDARDRKHMHLGPGLLGHASGEFRRSLWDWAPLGGEDDQFAREIIGRWRFRHLLPGPAKGEE